MKIETNKISRLISKEKRVMCYSQVSKFMRCLSKKKNIVKIDIGIKVPDAELEMTARYVRSPDSNENPVSHHRKPKRRL